MIRTIKLLPVISSLLIIFLSACQSIDEVENQENLQDQVVIEEPEFEEPLQEKVEEEEEKDPFQEALEKGLGDYNITMSATARIEEEVIVVEGNSNLLPGTIVYVRAERVTGFPLQMPLSERGTVDENGNFQIELRNLSNRYDSLRFYLSMHITQHDKILEHYGEHNLHIEGPLVYREENFHGELVKEARLETVIHFLDEKEQYVFEVIERLEKPDDYGAVEVWMETIVSNDHRYIYIHGRTNLLEGMRLTAEYFSSEGTFISQNNPYAPSTYVQPDGSFYFMVSYRSLQKEGFVKITSSGSDKLPSELALAYGEQNEKLSGDIVVTRPDGSRRIETRVYPEVPDLEVPEDVSLTSEEEETVMIVPDHMLFDFDDSNLKAEAKEVLLELITTLEKFDNGTVIEIRGHTDSIGDPSYNLRLSQERATSVLNFIAENGNTDHLKFEMKGFGETKPIASNDNEEGRERNRRVEMVINPKR